jgi:hypothetical protein
MPTGADTSWRLSYKKFLGLKRALNFTARKFSVQVLFMYSEEPVTVAWLQPVLMKYEFQRLIATFVFRAGNENFLAGSYYPKAEAFVVEMKAAQVGDVVRSFSEACVPEPERNTWAEKLKAGRVVKCPELSGYSWA